MSDYMARKIRQRVKDPAVAEQADPRRTAWLRHPPGAAGDLLFRGLQSDNVELVDLSETPDRTITPEGIRTIARSIQFDIIIYATGFDAITGQFRPIDIRGGGGVAEREMGPRAGDTLGMMVDGSTTS